MRYGGTGGLHPSVGGVVLLEGFARITSGPVVLGELCRRFQTGQTPEKIAHMA